MPSSRKARIAVFASGGGTNLQCLIDAAQEGGFPAEISLVLTNNSDAYCLERARLAGIASEVVDHRGFQERAAFESVLDRILKAHAIEYICLAGFMRILTAGFVASWHNRMLNIHPSLLPNYKGLNTHQRALEAGDQKAGATVHLVRPELDNGPLLIQAEVPILAKDTPDTLAARVLVREHEIYPMALSLLASGQVTVVGNKALIDGREGPILLPSSESNG